MKALTRKRYTYRPRYLRLLESGEGWKRVDDLKHILSDCTLCPRKCRVDRNEGERGYCRTGRLARLARACVHGGEEPPLSGNRGSGTIFFAHCNLRCIYCQNHQISQPADLVFPEISSQDLAREMLALQHQGCHNINFVSPSHVYPQMAEAILRSAEQGLRIPIVCNTNGYDSVRTLKLLDGLVDIYLPDFKYAGADVASDLSDAWDYSQVALPAIQEMHRQVGNLRTDPFGQAVSGVVVRHLALPGTLDQSRFVLKCLADSLGSKITVSLMSQYYPAHRALMRSGLDREITEAEYGEVLQYAKQLGLDDLWTQELGSHNVYRPDFSRAQPFEYNV